MVLGSGIRKKPIPDPGSRGQKALNPGSRIRIRNTGITYLFGKKVESFDEAPSYYVADPRDTSFSLNEQKHTFCAVSRIRDIWYGS
jgi:hypothetical protein